MKALVFDGALKLIEDYPDPKAGPGEALVRVKLAGICNTDIEITRGYMDFHGILGHEFVGVVEEAEDARLVGKRVVGEINLPCGSCPTCRKGLGNHCPNRRVLGIQGHPGAFAEFLTLPTAYLHVVPERISDDEAVFVEPLAAACQITRQIQIEPETRVCVLGDGKLGLLVVQVLAPKSIEKMSRVGLPGLERVLVDDLGQTPQFDVVVDCTGSPEGLTTAMKVVRPRGTIVLKTTAAAGEPVNLAPLVVNEVTVVGSRCGPFDEALRLLQERKVAVTPLVSARFGIDRALEAFDAARRPDTLKVLIDFAL